jgi:hypothetical protein
MGDIPGYPRWFIPQVYPEIEPHQSLEAQTTKFASQNVILLLNPLQYRRYLL